MRGTLFGDLHLTKFSVADTENAYKLFSFCLNYFWTTTFNFPKLWLGITYAKTEFMGASNLMQRVLEDGF
jgi:hypothetical protein